jgi:hypothetical protein
MMSNILWKGAAPSGAAPQADSLRLERAAEHDQEVREDREHGADIKDVTIDHRQHVHRAQLDGEAGSVFLAEQGEPTAALGFSRPIGAVEVSPMAKAVT